MQVREIRLMYATGEYSQDKRDWWVSAALPDWRLHGWTYRNQATFVRVDGTGSGMEVSGEMAAEIIRLRAALKEKNDEPK